MNIVTNRVLPLVPVLSFVLKLQGVRSFTKYTSVGCSATTVTVKKKKGRTT